MSAFRIVVADDHVFVRRGIRTLLESRGWNVLAEASTGREAIGKVTRVLKMKLTPFEVGLKETFKWYVRNHKPRTAGFEFDDKVLALAKAGSPLSV